MTIDPSVVLAILGILGVGVIGITEALKKILRVSGLAATLLAAVVSFAATAFYLSKTPPFNWLAFFVYGLLVTGEATGLYKVITKPK